MALHVGDTIEIDVTIKIRDTGVLTDPTTLSIRVTSPVGSVVTYAYPSANVVKLSTGKYRATVDCTAVGRWHFTWLSPGPTAKGSEPGYFDVEGVT